MDRVTVVAAWLAAVAIVGGGGGASRADDKVIGAVCELRVKLPGKEDYASKGLFRCTLDGKVHRDGRVVGRHKAVGADDVEITIDGMQPGYNGTSRATRVEKGGRVWEGVGKNQKGV